MTNIYDRQVWRRLWGAYSLFTVSGGCTTGYDLNSLRENWNPAHKNRERV